MLIACQKQGKVDSVNCQRESSQLLRCILLRGTLSQASSLLPGKCSGCICIGISLWDVASSRCLVCHQLTATTVNPSLEAGDENSLEATNTENLHDHPFCVGFRSLGFLSAEIAAGL